jgi:hypothetical protein
MAVEVETAPAFRASVARRVFEGNFRAYDVAPDGKRFLVIKQPEPRTLAGQMELHVIVNWFEDLRQKAPATK